MAKVPQATSRTSRPIAWRWNRCRRKAEARVTRRGSYNRSKCSAMIRYQRAWAFPCSLPENRTCNDEALDLRRPFIDLRDALVSIQLLHDVVFDESVPAVDLNRRIDGSMGCLRCEEFRDAGFVRVPLPEILQVRGAIGQQAGGVDLRRHVRELPLNRLEVRNLLAERLSFLRVLRGLLEGPLGNSEGLRRDADPAPVESCHRDGEAFVEFSQQIVFGDPTAIEAEGDRVARADSYLVLLLPDGEAFRIARHDERRDLVFFRARPGVHDDDLGDGRVRREGLRAPQDPLVPLEGCRGPHRGRVGPAAGFRESVRSKPFASRHGPEKLSLLPLGPVVEERFTDEAVAHGRDHPGARIATR